MSKHCPTMFEQSANLSHNGTVMADCEKHGGQIRVSQLVKKLALIGLTLIVALIGQNSPLYSDEKTVMALKIQQES